MAAGSTIALAAARANLVGGTVRVEEALHTHAIDRIAVRPARIVAAYAVEQTLDADPTVTETTTTAVAPAEALHAGPERHVADRCISSTIPRAGASRLAGERRRIADRRLRVAVLRRGAGAASGRCSGADRRGGLAALIDGRPGRVVEARNTGEHPRIAYR
jgi:hypothetical protein